MAVCEVCFRHCRIEEGQTGFCGARTARRGRVEPLFYGAVSSLALDPIEKKPLARFYPGSLILSAGAWGCNLRCPFCQNHEISWSEAALRSAAAPETRSPEELADLAERLRPRGNLGIAFTYNEPLVNWEFVRDTAALMRERGMKTVLVTNGTAEQAVLRELLPLVDAMNIDLKGFTDRYYEEVLKGSLSQVKAFIETAVQHCHVELTTLIVPGENDGEDEMRALSSFVAGLKDGDGRVTGTQVPLHITRFFPRFRMRDRGATEVAQIRRLVRVAQEQLKYVYAGNC